jgi:hypothetical protein
MTLYELVRRTLAERGGECHKGELLNAILMNPDAAQRLARGRGFNALLRNMKYSGFIEIDGQHVRRTARRVGRRR